MHHHLYVPYHYGAQCNHPLENTMLDTVSAVLSMLLSGMSTRQAMIYNMYFATNAVTLHAGYYFPWNPLRRLSDNDTLFHDIHHQKWGLKVSTQQRSPFDEGIAHQNQYNYAVGFNFWDRLCGTYWKDEQEALRLYEKARVAAGRGACEEKRGKGGPT